MCPARRELEFTQIRSFRQHLDGALDKQSLCASWDNPNRELTVLDDKPVPDTAGQRPGAPNSATTRKSISLPVLAKNSGYTSRAALAKLLPMQQWIQDYVAAQKAALDSIPAGAVSELIETFQTALKEDRQIFIFGNGGSAANASHFATDLGKGSSDKLARRFRCLSLNDNVSWLTALGASRTAWPSPTGYSFTAKFCLHMRLLSGRALRESVNSLWEHSNPGCVAAPATPEASALARAAAYWLDIPPTSPITWGDDGDRREAIL